MAAISYFPDIVSASQYCSVIDAHYTLMADHRYTVSFDGGGKEANPLRMILHSKKTGIHYPLRIVTGNGYSDALLYPDVPEGSAKEQANSPTGPTVSLFQLGTDLSVKSEEMVDKAPAPAYLFVPQLGINLFYLPKMYGGRENGSVREDMPRGLFKLKSCQK